jgi:DNA-3-methyladenine glycosylase I
MDDPRPRCRCPWVDQSKPDYVAYHDEEWGVPVHDDRKMFEFIILEGAQAGLSWYTVLKKRANYRLAFDDFDPLKIASYDMNRVETLLQNPGIIRNRAKVLATINNAQRYLEVVEKEGGFCDFLWQFVGGKPIVNELASMSDYPATTTESDAMSKALKKLGFKFIGPTICYAHMQATGMVNDHSLDCYRRAEILAGY